MKPAKEQLDFIVIGAQKAGTSSLFEYLRRHPDLRLPAEKEAPYFSDDVNYGRDWSEYLRKAFPFAEPTSRWGTVTPQYMVGGLLGGGASDERTVPQRIRGRLPDVRLIALARDPVERARSHHAMAVMNGWDQRSFAQAVDELVRPEALDRARRTPAETTGYVTWGEYGRILAGYLDVFPREQLLLLFTDDLRDDPAGVLRRVFEFLGVAPDFIPDNLGRRYRTSGETRRLKWLDLSAFQAALASSKLARRAWHALPEPTRRRVNVPFNRLNYRIGLWNRRQAQAPAADDRDRDTERALREHFRGDAERLETLFGAPPPWTAGDRALTSAP